MRMQSLTASEKRTTVEKTKKILSEHDTLFVLILLNTPLFIIILIHSFIV